MSRRKCLQHGCSCVEVGLMVKIAKRPATMWTKLPVVLDTEDVAIIFGLTEVQVRALARSGKLPCFKVGKNWRFEKGALMKFCGADTAQ